MPQAPGVSMPGPAKPAGPTLPGLPGMPQATAPAAPAVAAPNVQAPGGLPKPKVPAPDNKKLAKMLQPYLDLGKDVASGKNPPT